MCEALLERWAEPFSSFAGFLLGGDGTSQYLTAQRQASEAPALLRLAWRYLLKNQPHDSICGCSIDQVHLDMNTRYDWCQQIAELVTGRALEALAGASPAVRSPPRPSGDDPQKRVPLPARQSGGRNGDVLSPSPCCAASAGSRETIWTPAPRSWPLQLLFLRRAQPAKGVNAIKLLR